MHYFPKNEAVCQKWIRLVRRHRKDYKPSNLPVLCSVHFEECCFQRRPIVVPRENGDFFSVEERIEARIHSY